MADHDSTIPVTVLLQEASGGNREALNALFPLIYDELKAVAGARLRMERADHTLNATALVSEAYIKLVDQTRIDWQSRGHFFSVAALAMRRILCDYAEARNAQKRGGKVPHVALDALGDVLTDDQAQEFLALNQAIDKLGEFNPRGRDVIQYRFFCGLSYDEIAEVMGLAAITVRRSWTVARAWLRRELGEGAADSATQMLGVAES